jgi:hypothetical protein
LRETPSSCEATEKPLHESLVAKQQKNCFMDTNNKPPLFKSWASWYVLVIIFLVLLIFLFYLFTKKFA